jgi:hypothetical protein
MPAATTFQSRDTPIQSMRVGREDALLVSTQLEARFAATAAFRLSARK